MSNDMDNCYLLILFLIAGRIILLHALDYNHSFQSVIYVDSKNGTSESVCWTGGEKQPCSSLDLALEGARQLNSTVVIPAGQSAVSYTYSADHSYTDTNTTAGDDNCPPWHYYNGTTCECGHDLDRLVYCDPNMDYILVLSSYCMTLHNNTDTAMIVVSACLYNFINISKTKPYLSNYHKLPLNSSKLNEAMCGHFNREGRLCGQCKPGYYSPVYSYDLRCMNCTYTSYNWVIYILVAFGPLTIFLFLIFIFRINVTSPPLVSFVLLCQISTAPVIVRLLLIATESNSTVNTLARVMTSLYGIWNLDFFRSLLPSNCLELTNLQILALDYVIAFYPLAVIMITYFVIELYEREYRLVRWLWRPFHRCCVDFRRQWDVRTSIIDVFATFLFLSVIKFISVSNDILVPTFPYNMHGEQLDTVYLYYNPTVEYFGTEHLPFAIMALCILLSVVIFPLVLLMLYPCQCCQRCLTHFRLQSHALRTIMDAFHGSFKDGTDGTRDCRYFSAVYLGTGFLLYIAFGFTPNIYFWPLTAMAHVSICILHVLFQPYKRALYNNVACIMYLLIALYSILFMAVITAVTYAPGELHFSIILFAILGPLPELYIVGVFMHWLIYKKKLLHTILQKLHIWNPSEIAQIDFDELLPDRLANPVEYERLLSDPAGCEEDNEALSDDTIY